MPVASHYEFPRRERPTAHARFRVLAARLVPAREGYGDPVGAATGLGEQDREGVQHDRRAARVLPAAREIAEAFGAWRKGGGDLGEELADVAIYLLGLAEMTGVDLQEEIEAKIAKNASRVYRRLPDGTLVKDGAEADR